MAAGAHGRRGPHPALRSRRANFSSPGPAPPAGPPPARSLALPPPAQRPTTSGARPLPPPAPAPAARNRPRRSPLAARGPQSARPARSGPAPRALNPLAAAGDARGAGPGPVGAVPAAGSFSPGSRTPLPSPVLRICSFQLRGSRTPCPARTGSGPGFPSLLGYRSFLHGKGRAAGPPRGGPRLQGSSGGASCDPGGLRAAQVGRRKEKLQAGFLDGPRPAPMIMNGRITKCLLKAGER